ncbi:UxaA family hydrolase [Inhella gelatinilytica]|uniref:Altronate dehydratase n=1 Tax=Inhella gelatinilytica TaxID=2795030 RepID=A0A931NF44_9BURK|nr:altronate dehydratase family protein [Inhella gelatinilytica]MBH9553880.1 altronate dehydratase [Inhella gelatinilytica]
MNPSALPSPLLLLHPADDVFIARSQLVGGQTAEGLTVRGLVPAGHKVARRDLAAGRAVRRYSQVIGFTLRDIAAGEHVHVHNLGMGDFERHAVIGADVTPDRPPLQTAFMGIRRPNGQVATRNYIGVLTSVNCSATVARAIADHFSHPFHARRADGPLAAFAQVDGVVALTHGSGCAMDDQGLGLQVLRRTLAGYARHPNFAAILVVGLGCESNQIDALLAAEGLEPGPLLQTFNIQSLGGTSAAVARGVELIRALLPVANAVHREPCSAEHLIVGLQCGGSDGYSGISANPALGQAVDRLVQHGGTALLSETPEIYGAEHLLARRAISPAVGEKLAERIRWWEAHVAQHGGSMDNNPSPGNKAGGLTTILEKSLGAVAKGGTSNLVDVIEYAQPVRRSGLVFMDTPGYDPVSATGQVAGGANLICFTTGRGSAYGCAPAPSLKLATNTALWQRQADDIDLNCGDIIDGRCDIDTMGARIFQALLDTASGHKTRSETHGYGQSEFTPWPLGAVM